VSATDRHRGPSPGGSSVAQRRRYDVAVVGGGIVGLATAYQLLVARPDLSVIVVERDERVGTGQSSRNSGVLHAGLYYPPGSAKARWCRSGKAQLERYCAEHGVAVERSGKVVAAVSPSELPGLRALAERARTNGVEVHELDARGVRDHEPHVTAVAGLWSPTTAVTDFGAVCRSLATAITSVGGEVVTGAEVIDLVEAADEVRLTTRGGDVRAAQVVTSAGLQADRVARLNGADGDERIVPFRGSWLELRPDRRHLVRGNIYPVPGGGLPFLGVHLSRRVDGSVWIGPNAVLALAREGSGPWSVDARDLAATLRFPGSWRLATKHRGTAMRELWRDRVLPATVREVQRYVPEIRLEDVRRGPWGVRAQLLGSDGELVDDFTIRRSRRVLHVVNAPSPAATACLAIGEALRDRVLEAA
jgi:(S)-2-hydroxyglutarate dehydrogenase